MIKSYEKYDNKLPYPKLLKQEHPQPKRKDFQNYTDHGKAMDQWEMDCIVYNSKRKNLIEAYQHESSKMIDVFFADLVDELGWNIYTQKQQDALKRWVWNKGHSHGFPECYSVALEIDELVSDFGLLDKE